jgi:CRISPR-associated protein Csm3
MTIISIGRVIITAKLDVLSGLHIGAGKDTIEIGGIDSPVIKNPHTGEPFVPGSSLKGKIRFLLEWAFGKIRESGEVWGPERGDTTEFDPDDAILRIFGTPAKVAIWKGGPTRLICRDANLDPIWGKQVLDRGLSYTEAKTEVVIDRLAGKASDSAGGPRQTERVPAGAKFDAEFVFKLYDTGDGGARDRQCLAWFIAGLDLLEQDALGGSGSRGYGRVRFSDLTMKGLDGLEISLDNVWRGHRFDPKTPPADLMTAIEAATRLLASA